MVLAQPRRLDDRRLIFSGLFESGGRWWDRTTDPYDVNAVASHRKVLVPFSFSRADWAIAQPLPTIGELPEQNEAAPGNGGRRRMDLAALCYTITQRAATPRRLARQGAWRSPLRVGRFTLQWRRACTRYHGEPSIHRKGTAEARSPWLGGRLDHLP
jgi:hypothetical protein